MQKTETFFFIHRRCEEKILRSKTTTKKFYRISLRYKSFYNVVQRLWMDDPVTYVSFSLEICSTFFHEYYVSLSFIIKQALLSYQPLVEYPVIYVKYARYEKYFHLHENPILPVRFDNWSAIKFDRVTSKENDNKFLTRRYLGDQRPRGVKVRHVRLPFPRDSQTVWKIDTFPWNPNCESFVIYDLGENYILRNFPRLGN